jgi:hypothetical protein
VRATLYLLMVLLVGSAHAQVPLEVGSPETAFAGGPIRLSKNALGVLRAHYQGDKVPLVPQPFRARLDTAVTGRDWVRVDALKKDLAAKDGMVEALAWEQSRFLATGSIAIAEMHALDLAAMGSTGVSETAVMLWFYSAAVTMTDGHKCVDEAAKDAHLDRLRGPMFEPVTRIVRTISDDRLAAMRDLAIRLELVLAPDRTDDTMCRDGNKGPDIKPDPLWRPEAGATRGMLPRHLVALASVMRPRPIARPEPPKPDTTQPVTAKAAPETPSVPLAFFPPVLALPVPFEPAVPATATATPEAGPPSLTPVEPAPNGPTPSGTVNPEPPASAAATSPPAGQGARPATPAEPESPSSAVVDRIVGKPNPGRFEPPSLELTAPNPQPKQ